MAIEITKKTEPSFVEEEIHSNGEDWREHLKAQLVTEKGEIPIITISQFTILKGELYSHGPQGWLAGALVMQRLRRN